MSEINPRIETLLSRHQPAAGAATKVVQAPGRVNLLGEHTDYSGGFCMPAALSYNTLVAVSPRPDRKLRLYSLDFEERVEVDLDALPSPQKGHWSAYCIGVAWSLEQERVPLRGGDLTLTGNVPQGSGLSSSASVEVATATALLHLAGVTLPGERIALICQRAENDYVGAPCGIMDQFISACGRRGNALALDTLKLTYELAPLPETVRLVIANSMVRHSIGGGEYGTRRREVEEAAAAIGVRELRDATLLDLIESEGRMSRQAFLRGRHVITDSQRVLDGAAALKAGELRRFGHLMLEAHASYRDDFEASCEECDLLVNLAKELEGCYGARLTGGGFGGCTVNLVETGASEGFAQALAAGYEEATGITPEIYICELADGAGLVSES
ncbi:galactokinase [Granulicella sp. WH15]|uniref:galactokinase n=1 Tax=Granulicella sp. WH15 TaxID=2602070 RepID=UPI001366DEB4|nr:galactokinase [Granulicella sp. WH15]QHN04942.1 galactokinase [Granulicella sp. WH15]